MNSKLNNILYHISTIFLTIFLVHGAYMYLTDDVRIINAFNFEMINGNNAIGFPSWLILPMGIAKILGALALWIKIIPKWLREWAYAGIFFLMLLAIGAHLFNPVNPNDKDIIALFPLLMVIISRYTLFKKESLNS